MNDELKVLLSFIVKNYACAMPHVDGGNIAFVDGHGKGMKFQTTNLPGSWPAANSAGYAIHPPVETFSDVFQ